MFFVINMKIIAVIGMFFMIDRKPGNVIVSTDIR